MVEKWHNNGGNMDTAISHVAEGGRRLGEVLGKNKGNEARAVLGGYFGYIEDHYMPFPYDGDGSTIKCWTKQHSHG